MPYQPMDFSNLPIIGAPAFRNLAQNLGAGMDVAQKPDDIMAQQFKNALIRRYGDQEAQANLSLLNAQAQEARQRASQPFGGQLSGPARDSFALLLLKEKYGEDSDVYKQALNQTNANIGSKETYSNSKMFSSLPQTERTRLLSYASGLGIPADEAIQRFTKGQTLQQIADEKGIKLSDVKPNYPMTGAVLTQAQNRNGFIAEIDSLSNDIRKGIGPYAQTIDGYSPQQIKDALLGLNEDQQSDFLAARGALPELAMSRTRALGGQVGIESIREMQDKSLGNLNVFRASVTPKVWDATQSKLSAIVGRGVQAFNNSLYGNSALGGPPSALGGAPIVGQPNLPNTPLPPEQQSALSSQLKPADPLGIR